MKYKCMSLRHKYVNRGGDYWRGSTIYDHYALTNYQTSYRYIVDKYKSPLTILEAGCGLGRWAVPLALGGFIVTGIDIEQDALDILKQFHSSPNLTVVHGDILAMPFPDESFDLVLSLGVLEHFEDARSQHKALSEHLRVLKCDGALFVTVPYLSIIRLFLHMPYIWVRSIVRKHKHQKQYFSEYRYGLTEFRRILESNHLNILDVVWDDLLPPYSFGLTVDYPLRRFTRSADAVPYKLNTFGRFLHLLLWNIHPALISGGIGFLCKKQHR